MKKIFKNKKGFSLIETLIYIFMLTVLLVALIQTFSYMLKTSKDIKSEKSIISSASVLLNRFTYEVRRATDVSGTFGTSSGSLTLTFGTTTTIIYLDNSTKRAVISVNGAIDYLTSSDITVNSLIFNKLLATTTSKGAYMQLSMTNKFGTAHTENFETSAIIREQN
jgi:type II secretory pathway pseudopilin PulG